MDLLKVILPKLKNRQPPGYWEYWDQPIPSELDNEICRLIDFFIQTEDAGRELISLQVTAEHSQKLFAFSERMASLGVREQSSHRLLQGLLVLAIEDFKFDWRENLSRFSLFYDASEKIGIPPASLFAEAASYASQEVAAELNEFPKRAPDMKSLGAMGYKTISSADGFRYAKQFEDRFIG